MMSSRINMTPLFLPTLYMTTIYCEECPKTILTTNYLYVIPSIEQRRRENQMDMRQAVPSVLLGALIGITLVGYGVWNKGTEPSDSFYIIAPITMVEPLPLDASKDDIERATDIIARSYALKQKQSFNELNAAIEEYGVTAANEFVDTLLNSAEKVDVDQVLSELDAQLDEIMKPYLAQQEQNTEALDKECERVFGKVEAITCSLTAVLKSAE